MSQYPPTVCPRCRIPAPPGTAFCQVCGQQFQAGASPPPPQPSDGLTRKERFKASFYSTTGGMLTFFGGMGALLAIAMAISGPTAEQRPQYSQGEWLAVVLTFLAIFVLPPLVSGVWLLLSAGRIRRLGQQAARRVVPPVALDPVSQTELEIRRLLKTLSGPYQDAASRVVRELDELLLRHREMEQRLNALNAMAATMPGPELQSQSVALLQRLEVERDPIIAASLRKQLQGVEGQLEARESVETSCARLKAARDASMDTLLCLKAELVALSANATNPGREELEAETRDLRELSTELQHTRLATEEVLRISYQ